MTDHYIHCKYISISHWVSVIAYSIFCLCNTYVYLINCLINVKYFPDFSDKLARGRKTGYDVSRTEYEIVCKN